MGGGDGLRVRTRYSATHWVSFVLYNPLRYVDPSGHKACDPNSDDDCKGGGKQEKDYKIKDFKSILKNRFGINISDKYLKWTLKGLQTIYKAVVKINAALSGKFKDVFSGTTLYFKEGAAGKYGGWASGKTISFHGNFPIENAIHEFGHVFDTIFGDIPSKVLEGNTWRDENGTFVMGRENGQYNRQSRLGYSPQCISASTACSTEQHPRDLGTLNSGNNGGEEWADLFLNYVNGTFDTGSPAGRARLNITSGIIDILLSNLP